MSIIKDIALAKAIGGGGPSVTVEELTVNQNGTTTAPEGKAYNPVITNVQPPLQQKTVSANGDVTPDTGYYGLSKVIVDVPQGGGGGANPLQFHLGRLTINTGEIAESSMYCYSDLIPISQGPGWWFLDLARSNQDVQSYYIGISFFAQDGETNVGYIRQYENYRSYQNTSGANAKYFRIANNVSNMSFASAAFLGDGVYVAPQSGNVYQNNLE